MPVKESYKEHSKLFPRQDDYITTETLSGRWILTAGLGGMGGAQPLAAVMAGACCLVVECDPERIDFRLRTGYLDEKAEALDEALNMIRTWTDSKQAKSVGLLGNAAEIFS